jgi:hypothetical protein
MPRFDSRHFVALQKLSAAAAADPELARALLVAPAQTLSHVPTLSTEDKSLLRALGSDAIRGSVADLGGGSQALPNYLKLNPGALENLGGGGLNQVQLAPYTLPDPSLTAGDAGITWYPADYYAFLNDPSASPDGANAPWLAGRLTDVLVTQSGLLYVASAFGGVWLVSENGYALAMTANMVPPTLNTIAEDPAVSDDIYAGGIRLFGSSIGWAPIPTPWLSIGNQQIRQIAISTDVFNFNRKLVLATDAGVWWAPLLAPGASANQQAAYWQNPGAWQQAMITGAPPNPSNAFCSIVAFVNGVVAAATDGATYTGSWVGNTLVLTWRGNPLTSVNAIAIAPSYMALCKDRENTDPLTPWIWAAARDSKPPPGVNTDLAGIMQSTDGGSTWNIVANAQTDQALQKVGTSAGMPVSLAVWGATIVVGWQNLQISHDGGASWVSSLNGEPRLHQDTRAARFLDVPSNTYTFGGEGGPRGKTFPRLFICSDGGLASSDDLGRTWTSMYNKGLRNLLFQGPPAGSLGLSGAVSDYIFGGLQDNEVLMNLVPPAGQGYWSAVSSQGVYDSGDGFWAMELGNGWVIWTRGGDDGMPRTTIAAIEGPGALGASALVPDYISPGQIYGEITDTYQNVFEKVAIPHDDWFSDASYPMWAVAGGALLTWSQNAQGKSVRTATRKDVLFGVFGRPEVSMLVPMPMGIMPIGVLGSANDPTKPQVTAVFSWDARTAFVAAQGTSGAFIQRFEQGASTLDPLPVGTVEPIGRFVPGGMTINKFARSAATGAMFAAVAGPPSLLRRSMTGFTATPVWLPFGESVLEDVAVNSICTDEDGHLFVATASTVYMYDEGQDAWYLANDGLPAWANCSDIRYVADPVEGPMLYLATYGWSVWKAKPPTIKAILVQP